MKLLLKRRAFSDDYVERIKAQIPESIHIIETNQSEINVKTISSDTLLILYGSKRTQTNQEIMCKLAHQPTNGFRVKLGGLNEWLSNLYNPKAPS